MKKTQERLLNIEAQEIVKNAEGEVIKKVFTGKSPDEVRFLALAIIRSGDYIVLFGTKLQDRVHLVLASSEKSERDMRDCIPVVSSLIEGKGGGRPTLVEIAGHKKENLELALEKASEFLGE